MEGEEGVLISTGRKALLTWVAHQLFFRPRTCCSLPLLFSLSPVVCFLSAFALYSHLMSLPIFPVLYPFYLRPLSTVCPPAVFLFPPELPCSFSLLTGLSSRPSSPAVLFPHCPPGTRHMIRCANLCLLSAPSRQTSLEILGHCFLALVQSHS